MSSRWLFGQKIVDSTLEHDHMFPTTGAGVGLRLVEDICARAPRAMQSLSVVGELLAIGLTALRRLYAILIFAGPRARMDVLVSMFRNLNSSQEPQHHYSSPSRSLRDSLNVMYCHIHIYVPSCLIRSVHHS